MHTKDMTYRMWRGSVWSLVFPGGRVPGEARREIIGSSAMRFPGFCGQALPGVACRRFMATGRICFRWRNKGVWESLPEKLIDGIEAGVLLADRGYDSGTIAGKAEVAGMQVVIPPRKNRREQRKYDEAFMELKRWRGIATRYVKRTASFLAAVRIRCLAVWARISWRHNPAPFL